MRALVALALAAMLLPSSGCRKNEGKPPLRVAAAADLAFAFKDLGDNYTKATGDPVIFSFGSTGLLAKQIIEGAPFDVFAAANVAFADDTVKSGACADDSKTIYASGRIVAWVKSPAAPPTSLADLADPKWTKIAIANPEHAPYGRAAKEALTRAGIWQKVESRLVYGENIQQTMQFAQSGNVEVSIVALSLAVVADGGAYMPIDPSTYRRIDQALVACKGAGAAPSPAARRFVAYVGSDEGRATMRKYGFMLPGDQGGSARAGE